MQDEDESVINDRRKRVQKISADGRYVREWVFGDDLKMERAPETPKTRADIERESFAVILGGVASETDIQSLKLKLYTFMQDHEKTLRDFAAELTLQKGDKNKHYNDSINDAWRRSPLHDRDTFNSKLDKFSKFLTDAITDFNVMKDATNQNASGTALLHSWSKDNKWAEMERMLKLSNVESRSDSDDLYVLSNSELRIRTRAAYESFKRVTETLKKINEQSTGPGGTRLG